MSIYVYVSRFFKFLKNFTIGEIDMNKKLKALLNEKTFFFVACIAIAILATSRMAMTVDSDILWHYKLGEEIILNRRISTSDTLSWQSGFTWIQYEWMFDVFIYFIIKYTGLIGFIITYAVNQFLLMFVAGIKNKATSDRLYYLIAMVSLIIIPKNCFNRPAEFSVWAVIILIEIYRSKSKYKTVWYWLVGLLIANFHGGTLMLLIATYLIMLAVDILFDIKQKSRNIKSLLIKIAELASMLIATLINPVGYHMLIDIFKVQGLESTKYIQEWEPTKVNYVLGILIVLAVISFGHRLKERKFNRIDCINIALMSGYLILGLTSQKAMIIFMYIWLIYGYKYIDKMVSDFFNRESEHKMKIKVFEPAILAAIISIEIIMMPSETSFKDYMYKETSVKIINYLQKENEQGNEIKICNSYNAGNYLIFNDIKCFVDSRQLPYTKEFGGNDSLDDMFNAAGSKDKEEVKEFIDKYSFDYIMTDKDLDLNWYLEQDTRYEIVMTDEIEKKFKSKDEENNKITLWKRKGA